MLPTGSPPRVHDHENCWPGNSRPWRCHWRTSIEGQHLQIMRPPRAGRANEAMARGARGHSPSPRTCTASSRLARAKAAAKFACARCWARLTELGVGWRSICASIDCRPKWAGVWIGCRLPHRSSNCAILVLHGPACADEMPKPKAATQRAAAIRRSIKCSQRRGCKGWAFGEWSGHLKNSLPFAFSTKCYHQKDIGEAQKGALLVRRDKHHHGTTRSITTGGSDECGGPQGGS